MKSFRLSAALSVCISLALIAAPVAAAPKHAAPAEKKTARKAEKAATPAFEAGTAIGGVTPPLLAARSWLLLDTSSDEVLASLKPDERAEPASLTKLMTAYVVFGALKAKPSVPTSRCLSRKMHGAWSSPAPPCSSNRANRSPWTS